jgi:hypothetical protein
MQAFKSMSLLMASRPENSPVSRFNIVSGPSLPRSHSRQAVLVEPAKLHFSNPGGHAISIGHGQVMVMKQLLVV